MAAAPPPPKCKGPGPQSGRSRMYWSRFGSARNCQSRIIRRPRRSADALSATRPACRRPELLRADPSAGRCHSGTDDDEKVGLHRRQQRKAICLAGVEAWRPALPAPRTCSPPDRSDTGSRLNAARTSRLAADGCRCRGRPFWKVARSTCRQCRNPSARSGMRGYWSGLAPDDSEHANS